MLIGRRTLHRAVILKREILLNNEKQLLAKSAFLRIEATNSRTNTDDGYFCIISPQRGDGRAAVEFGQLGVERCEAKSS